MEGYDNCNGDNSEVGGEAEPGEEGALVGEEDFGLDADGEGDPFGGGGEEGVG